MSRHGSSINISPTVIFARSQDSINNEFPSLIYSVRVAFVVCAARIHPVTVTFCYLHKLETMVCYDFYDMGATNGTFDLLV